MPRKTAHLPFRALPEPAADRAQRMKNFKLSEKRYEELRAEMREAAQEPATLQELREAAGAEAKELKGVDGADDAHGELVRVGAAGLRSNELRYVAADIEEADADEALAWLAGEYLRAFGPVRAEGLHLVVGRRRPARQGGARRARDRGARRRAADPQGGPQGVRGGQAAQGRRRPAPQVGLLPDGLRAGRPRPVRPPRCRQAVLRLPRRRPPGDPRRRRGGRHVGAARGRPVRKATPKVRKAIDQRIDAVKAFLDG